MVVRRRRELHSETGLTWNISGLRLHGFSEVGILVSGCKAGGFQKSGCLLELTRLEGGRQEARQIGHMVKALDISEHF